jgi:hypothetical protein
MVCLVRSTHIVVAAVGVCLVSAFSPTANSQAALEAPKLDIAGQPFVPNLNGYDQFIHNLGKEDDRIQKETQGGVAQSVSRRDFSSAIGFGKSDEQIMLAIVLDCYHREKAKDDQLLAEEIRLRHVFNNEEVVALRDNPGTLQEREKTYIQESESTRREKYAILRETWNRLKNDLGDESFKKLDKYVNSPKWKSPEPPGFGQTSAPTLKIPGWSYMAYPGAYRDFFDDIGLTDANNKRAAAEGQESMGFGLPDFIPADKRQVVIAIAIEAARQIKENDQQYISAAHEFSRQNEEKYGWKKAHEMPLPSEIEALGMRDTTIIEENTDKLRQALGEEYFNMLDKEFSRSNRRRDAAATAGEREVTPSSSPAGTTVPHQSDNISVPPQTPEVKP